MKSVISDIEGFAPIASGQPKVLILGSMPGVASLQKQQYYGHDRNAFWPIMAELFGAKLSNSYQQQTRMLCENGIAAWDVLKSCRRQGSLDANISLGTIKLNDFADFYDEYRLIVRVFFNGGMAETLYKKHIFPVLPQHYGTLEYRRLPSTSPAYATLNFKEKLEAWRAITQHVVK
jgi:hypoxanthine-DNA glycosylase